MENTNKIVKLCKHCSKSERTYKLFEKKTNLETFKVYITRIL